MKKLKTKWFDKWAKKRRISDNMLLVAIEDLKNSLSSTNLGGDLFKVRMANGKRGKSSSFRTIIVFRENDRVIMVYGFAKKEQENLSAKELRAFKALAKDILSLSSEVLDEAIRDKVFIEIGEKNEK